MALTKIDRLTSPISALEDQPNMTASELKNYFDSSPEQIRVAFNKLIDDLTTELNDLKNPTQSTLWNGAKFPVSSDTITPSKKLSECRNGWILIWSDNDPPNTPNNFDFAFTYIPKAFGTLHNGGACTFIIGSYASASSEEFIVKKLYVHNDKLVGNDDNNNATTGTNDSVLRYVLEY